MRHSYKDTTCLPWQCQPCMQWEWNQVRIVKLEPHLLPLLLSPSCLLSSVGSSWHSAHSRDTENTWFSWSASSLRPPCLGTSFPWPIFPYSLRKNPLPLPWKRYHLWCSSWSHFASNSTIVIPNLTASPHHWQSPDNYANSLGVQEEKGSPYLPRQPWFQHFQVHHDIEWTWLICNWLAHLHLDFLKFIFHCYFPLVTAILEEVLQCFPHSMWSLLPMDIRDNVVSNSLKHYPPRPCHTLLPFDQILSIQCWWLKNVLINEFLQAIILQYDLHPILPGYITRDAIQGILEPQIVECHLSILKYVLQIRISRVTQKLKTLKSPLESWF